MFFFFFLKACLFSAAWSLGGVSDLSLLHTGFSSCGAAGSVLTARSLSCPVTSGILVPGPGIEPVSPALEGGFLSTGIPGKSLDASYF